MYVCMYVCMYVGRYVCIYVHTYNTYMGLRQNSVMDRPAVIQTYGSVWITCVLVWIAGMDRPVDSGYGSGLYILTHSHTCIHTLKKKLCQQMFLCNDNDS